MSFDLQHIIFAKPWFFLLFGLIPFLSWLWFFKPTKKANKLSLPESGKLTESLKAKVSRYLPILRLIALASITLAVARPQKPFSEQKITTNGIDIVLALDISASMYATDFDGTRIESAKRNANDFIEDRPSDRIGLVAFAGEAFTQCPTTLDHVLLKSLVESSDNWQLDDGTAIGDGLWLALSRLSDSTNLSSKVVILLTDGVRTAGKYAPKDAALAAKDLDIRVYTIGMGKKSNRPIRVVDPKRGYLYDLPPNSSFDEETLLEVAEITGGKYFHATSDEKLASIYKEIDQLEKESIEVDVSQRFEERFHPFAALGLLLFVLEWILGKTFFRRLI
jgi:Ca-activated chloride channel family protein